MKRARCVAYVAVASLVMVSGCGGTPSTGPSYPSSDNQLVGLVTNGVVGGIAGVRVVVSGGSSIGEATTTDEQGYFRLPYDFRSAGQLAFAKDGYAPLTMAVQAGKPSGLLTAFLHFLDPPVNLAGSYTFTFVADASCLQIPDALRTRSYGAVISQPAQFPQSTRFDVRLLGATFAAATLRIGGALDSFSGAVEAHTVRFQIANGPESIELDEGIAEQIAPDVRLEIDGGAAITVADGEKFSGDMTGYVAVTGPDGIHKCSSTTHRIAFVRTSR